MKVALVFPAIAVTGAWGGILLAKQIGNQLSDLGHDVHTVELDHEPAAQESSPEVQVLPGMRFTSHHLRGARLKEGVNPLWSFFPRESDTQIATAWLIEQTPDVLYVHAYLSCPAFIAAAARLGIPIVYHVHDYAVLCGRSFLVDHRGRPCVGPRSPELCERCLIAKQTPLRRAATRLGRLPGGNVLASVLIGSERTESLRLRHGIEQFFKFRQTLVDVVDVWIATGNSVRDILVQYGIPAKRITLLRHAIPDERMHRSPGPPPANGRPVRIGYFGRISREKGVWMLADSLRALATRTDRDFEWRILSERVSDDDKVNLRSRSGLPPERVRFVEGLAGAQLNPALAQLDLCVLPSLWPEIGPLTLLEALAQGVPCICNDQSAHADLIEDGVNGYRFRTADQADLIEKLSLAISRVIPRKISIGANPPINSSSEFTKVIQAILKSAKSRQTLVPLDGVCGPAGSDPSGVK